MAKFVDKEIRVFEGDEAEKRLKEKNDSKHFNNLGIVKVPLERWKEAQEYEHKTWMIDGLGATSDHNSDNLDHLDNLSVIHNRKFKNAIELGCGPFTNICLMNIPMEKVTLLDPLMNEYLKHPRNRFHSKATKINSTIEDFATQCKYDLVVMINVLEHCFDVQKIFKKIVDMLEIGGILVFGDIAFPRTSIAEMSQNTYNAGHPIRIDEYYLAFFLTQHFKKLYMKSFQVKCAGYEAYENYSILERV